MWKPATQKYSNNVTVSHVNTFKLDSRLDSAARETHTDAESIQERSSTHKTI